MKMIYIVSSQNGPVRAFRTESSAWNWIQTQDIPGTQWRVAAVLFMSS